MDESERQSLADGALALQLLAMFFGAQIKFGHYNLPSVLQLIDNAETNALTMHGALDDKIVLSAEAMRSVMRKTAAKHRPPSA